MPDITGTWRRDGEPVAGSWKIRIPTRVTGLAGDEILPAGWWGSGVLSTDPTGPSLLISSFPSSANTLPPGWRPVLSVDLVDGRDEVYALDVSGGTTIDLATIVLDDDFTQPSASLVRGAPGGVAGLDVQGHVLDGAGQVVLGDLWGPQLVWNQAAPSATWTIPHAFPGRPAVSVFAAGDAVTPVFTDVHYPDATTVTVEWPAPTAGVAYLR